MPPVAIETIHDATFEVPDWIAATVVVVALGAAILLAWMFWPRKRD